MSNTTIARLAVLEEAVAIEAKGGDWRARHVMAVADCSRSTVYDTAWMLQCSRRVGKSGRRWNPKEFRDRQALESKRMGQRRTGT